MVRPASTAEVAAVVRACAAHGTAIVPQGGRMYVYRLVDGPDQDTRIARRVEVKVGIRQPGKVEVVEGLQAGDVVVTAGQQRIQRDGMPVRVVEVGRGAAMAQGGASAPVTAQAGASAPAAPAAPARPEVEVVQSIGGGCGPVAQGAEPAARAPAARNGA